jgi:periplasmic protein TonB
MGTKIFSDWENVTDSVRNDLVFQSRNKSYGAYLIRREYDRTLLFAFLITGSLIGGVLGIQALVSYFRPVDTDTALIDIKGLIEIPFIVDPPNDPVTVPKSHNVVPPAPVAPVSSTERFVTPTVVDKPVTGTDQNPQVIENPGATTTVGTPVNTPAVITENPGGSAIGKEDKPFVIVTEMPEFPGGDKALLQYVRSNTKYPQLEKENHIQGTVHMSFVIDQEGNVTEIQLLKGVKGGKGLEDEAFRVLRSLPKWKPGKNNGQPVKVIFNMPFTFSLK